MKMRKVPAILAATVLTFGLAACGGGGQSVDEACRFLVSEIDAAEPAGGFDSLSEQLRVAKAVGKRIRNKDVRKAQSDVVNVLEERTALSEKYEHVELDPEKEEKYLRRMDELEERYEEARERYNALCFPEDD